MEISEFFKSVIDSDTAPVVICDLRHIIIYMNPSAVARYKKHGGEKLVGSSLLDCHNGNSVAMIEKVVGWFAESPENNRVFTFHNEKENKDVYMVALRDGKGRLAGYYEKHEIRTPETSEKYDI